MKKSLLLLLSLAMVFTMFASVAFAADDTAELTPQQKFDALVKAGVMTGTVVNGETVSGLDLPMNRAQIAEVLVNLFNLPKTATASSFTDVAANHWAMQQIEAAKTAGYMVGNGDGTFTPNKDITLEQVASVICEVFGLAPATDAAVGGTVSGWAKGYVAAAVAAGLLANTTDYTASASRADLVNVSFSAYEKVEAPVTATASFAATGASKITVSYSKAIDDTAAFTVKKGSIPINVSSTKLSDDKKSIVLTTSTKLTKGEYTIEGTNPTVSGTVTVDDEKVAKITFASDKAPLETVTGVNAFKNAYAFIKVYNQYNEDVTSAKATGLKVTVGGVDTAATSSGKITLTAPGGTFVMNQSVVVTALDVASATFASAVLTIDSPAQAATITVSKLADADGEAATPAVGKTAGDYMLYVSAKDQYGNKVDLAGFLSDIIVSATNPTVANVDTFTTNGDDIVLPLKTSDADNKFTTAGTSTIILLSKTTGNKVTFDVTVKDEVKVDVFSVTAPSIAVAGESFTIPFQAVDQFGAAITSASTLSKSSAFLQAPSISSLNANDVAFKQDYVNGTASLEVDTSSLSAITSAQTLFFSAVTSTGKLVTLNITVQPIKKPVVVTGVTSAVKVALAKGASTTIKAANINVIDQYNRASTLDKFSGYSATIGTSNKDTVGFTNGTDLKAASATITGNTVTINGNATGNATITITLNDSDGAIANSAKTISFKVVDTSSITDYTVADIATLYATGATSSTDNGYAKSVTVNGLLSDGTVVALKTDDTNYYTVTVATYSTAANGIHYTGGKLFADSSALATDKADITIPVTVVATTNNGAKVISKTVTVSSKEPVATTVALRSGDHTVKENDGLISVALADITGTPKLADFAALANDAVKVTDQYGVEISANKFASVIQTNVPGNGTLAGVAQGKSFNITAITKNGMTVSFKVIVN